MTISGAALSRRRVLSLWLQYNTRPGPVQLPQGAKKPPVRAAGGVGNDLRNGGDGGHGQDDQTQHDAVETEELEVMALDVIHQEADGGKADH